MTVCTAALFMWNYAVQGGVDFGTAIIAAADRTLTDEGLGIKYEAHRFKGAVLSKTNLVLVSGAMVIHSAVVQKLNLYVKDNKNLTVLNIADMCGVYLAEYKAEQAQKLYLSPLNISASDVFSGNSLINSALGAEIVNQLQSYKIDAEAMVLGCEGNDAHIYRVTNSGIVDCFDDIGFLSIGSGGIHSTAHFMVSQWAHTSNYYQALYSVYLAKKRAESDPFVGKKTDIFLIKKDGVIRIDDRIVGEMERRYLVTERAIERMNNKSIAKIVEMESELFPSNPNPTLKREQPA